jgi:hypothetical protein
MDRLDAGIVGRRPFVIFGNEGYLAKLAKNWTWRSVGEDVRTLFTQRDPELLCILADIKTLEEKFGIKRDDDRPLAAYPDGSDRSAAMTSQNKWLARINATEM